MVKRAKANSSNANTSKKSNKPATWDTIMPLPSNPDTGETANDFYILDCETHVMPEDYRSFIQYFEGTKLECMALTRNSRFHKEYMLFLNGCRDL